MTSFAWRMELHAQMVEHDFVVDVDDPEGECVECVRLDAESDWGAIDRAWDTKREQDMLADLGRG
jgi:hypothetical protein